MTDSAHSPVPASPRKADAKTARAAAAAVDAREGGTTEGGALDHAMPAVLAKTLGGLSAEGLAAFFARETARYTAQRGETRRALRADAPQYMGGVPMAAMRDWPLPYPLVIATAEEARLVDLDGFEIDDFCLAGGAALFGHTPPAVLKALRKQGERGLGYLFPSRKALAAGAAMSEVFGPYQWQIALSEADAVRDAIKLARAVTRREKVLVFNGAHHGAVDDVMVRSEHGRTKARRGLVGQVHDLRRGAICVEFNDLDAVAEALASGEVAAILTEPVMTQCAMVLPAAGFLEGLRDLASRHDALLILDETHTQAFARGGYGRAHDIAADIVVAGKAVAGGLPAAVWGASDEVAGRFAAYDAMRAEGHSGMGNLMAGNALQAAAITATLTETANPKAFAKMEKGAARLAEGLREVIARFALPWQVVQSGARVALICAAQLPQNGSEAAATVMPAISRAIHIGLLNRGCLICPQHNAMLVSPVTSKVQINRLVMAFADVIAALAGDDKPQAEAPRAAAPVEDSTAPDELVVASTPASAAPRRGWWQKANSAPVVEAAEASVPATPAKEDAQTASAAPAQDKAPKTGKAKAKDAGGKAKAEMPVTAKPVAAAPVTAPAVLAPSEPVPAAAPRRKAGWWQKGAAATAEGTATPAKPAAVAPLAAEAVKAVPAAPVAGDSAQASAPAPAKAAAPAMGNPVGTAPRKGWWAKDKVAKAAPAAHATAAAPAAVTQAPAPVPAPAAAQAPAVPAAKPARRAGWWQKGG